LGTVDPQLEFLYLTVGHGCECVVVSWLIPPRLRLDLGKAGTTPTLTTSVVLNKPKRAIGITFSPPRTVRKGR